jgi:hypothetical protein
MKSIAPDGPGGYGHAMSVWTELRLELLRLAEVEPDVLLSYPSPEGEPDRRPPFSIRLEPTGLLVAQDLHRRFGDAVKLRVGVLPYPPAVDDSPFGPVLHDPIEPGHRLDGIDVELDAPLAVSSGETARHHVRVTNKATKALVVNTNGQLTARVVELATGKHVGGSAGFQRMPLVTFTVPPGETTRIPLLVATASYVSELGYVIPPGRWGLTADLKLADGRTLQSPVLPFDVVDRQVPVWQGLANSLS